MSERDDPREDLRPLCRALADCGIAADKIHHTARLLAEPPLSLALSASDDPDVGALVQEVRGWDPDMAARMSLVDEKQPDPTARSKTRSRAGRKRDKRLWDWTGKGDELGTTPQGRRPLLDAALVIYCTRVLSEACEERKFQFSRLPDGTPGGPMWRALMLALAQAQEFLKKCAFPGGYKHRIQPQAVEEIVRLTRSSDFRRWCDRLGLGGRAVDVDHNCATFRHVVTLSRSSRSQKRRTTRSRRCAS